MRWQGKKTWPGLFIIRKLNRSSSEGDARGRLSSHARPGPDWIRHAWQVARRRLADREFKLALLLERRFQRADEPLDVVEIVVGVRADAQTPGTAT